MEDVIECIADNVKNIFVGNVVHQTSNMLTLENSVIYGLAKINNFLAGIKTANTRLLCLSSQKYDSLHITCSMLHAP